MQMRRRAVLKWVALTAALVLLIGFLPSHAAADDVYFTAVNDTLKKLNNATMPFSQDGRYYMPYTIFDELALGVSYTYNKKGYTLTFYNKDNTLVFDLLQNYAYDLDQQYWESAIFRNNTLYIPIEFVCDEFNLKFSYISPTFSSIPILRIVSESNLDDYTFQLKHSGRLISERNEYYNQSNPNNPASPSPTPGKPQTSPGQDPELTEVCLTFDCETAEGIAETLDLLDQYGVKAVFFLSELVIHEERDIVRRIIGSGHQTGILGSTDFVKNEDGIAETAEEQIKRINNILDSYTCTKTRFIRFMTRSSNGGITKDQISSLENSGYSFSDVTINEVSHVSSTPRQTAINIINALEEAESLPIIRLEASTDLPDIMRNILIYLKSNSISALKITQIEEAM